ncbi:MAG: helix-turn-helix domain-containing protein [Firmicutes bacterium]|nr:helix-turn-helix domain-containing protein [Bacillota bacterium]
MGKLTRFRTIDMETGEIIEGVPVYIAPKIKLREGWFMGFQDAFEILAKDQELQGENYKVLLYLLSKLGFENYIAIPQKQIADALNMKKQNVSRALKVLVDKQILLEGPKLGRTHTYRLSSTFGWKGRVKNLAQDRNTVISFPYDAK